jgi:hypothetical protein
MWHVVSRGMQTLNIQMWKNALNMASKFDPNFKLFHFVYHRVLQIFSQIILMLVNLNQNILQTHYDLANEVSIMTDHYSLNV